MTAEMEQALKDGIARSMGTDAKAVCIIATEDGGVHVEHLHDIDTFGIDVAKDRIAMNWSRKF